MRVYLLHIFTLKCNWTRAFSHAFSLPVLSHNYVYTDFTFRFFVCVCVTCHVGIINCYQWKKYWSHNLRNESNSIFIFHESIQKGIDVAWNTFATCCFECLILLHHNWVFRKFWDILRDQWAGRFLSENMESMIRLLVQ